MHCYPCLAISKDRHYYGYAQAVLNVFSKFLQLSSVCKVLVMGCFGVSLVFVSPDFIEVPLYQHLYQYPVLKQQYHC